MAHKSVHTLSAQDVPDAVRAMNCVVVGNTGSGKSAAARAAFVEPLLQAGRRVCIIDPTGIWWGLRFMPDGSPGMKVAIIGGLHGDAELDPDLDDGAALAEWIGIHDLPVVIDLSEMLIGDRHRFAEHFFQALYKHNRRPLHLIVDEADEFGPQQPLPETRRLLHQFDRIVRRGRVRGFRVMMITQRPAVLHKNVMSQARVMVAMQLLASQDRDAVLGWIKGQGDVAAGKEVLNTLARLQLGEGWLWAPSLGILNRGRFAMFRTFDSSRTPGDDELAIEPPAKLPRLLYALDPLLAHLAATRKPPEPGGTKPARSKRRKSEPMSSTVQAIAGDELERARQEAHAAGRAEGIVDASRELLLRFQPQLSELHARLEQGLSQLSELLAGLKGPAPQSLTAEAESAGFAAYQREPVDRLGRPRERVAQLAPARASNPGQHAAATRLLQALARYPHRPLSWLEVCIVAGMSHGNGYFYGGRKYLIDGKLALDNGAGAIATARGIDQVDVRYRGRPVGLDDILQTWLPNVKAPGGEMLRAIAERPQRGISLNDLAAKIKRKPGNGYWYGGVKALRRAGLIEDRRGDFMLSPFLRDAAELMLQRGVTA